MAFLMRFVTAHRARSASAEVLRSRPPSPIAEARCWAIAFISSWALAARSGSLNCSASSTACRNSLNRRLYSAFARPSRIGLPSLSPAVTNWFPSLHSRPLARTAEAVTGVSRRLASNSLTWNSRPRSEEHTSELQSRQYLVCRLLLEKKKNEPSRQDITGLTASPLLRPPQHRRT